MQHHSLPRELLDILADQSGQQQQQSPWSIEDAINQLVFDEAGTTADPSETEGDGTDHDEDARRQARYSNPHSQLDVLQLGIRDRIQRERQAIKALESEIAAAQSLDRVSAGQERITELFTQIHHLRAGATESEIIVREITHEIKNLDSAKKNIVASITGVKRFQMLLVAFDQLTKQAKGRRYKETAHALSAVKELANHFRSFTSIERIASLLKGIQEIQGVMRTQVMTDFQTALGRGRDNAVQNNSEGISVSQLGDACLVLDAIGSDARQALLEWYCNQQLHDYRRIFRPAEEAGQLDNLSRRYGWFKRVVKQFEEGEHARVFPKEWRILHCLTGAFAAVTKDDLKSVLVRVAGGLDVKRLLEALNETTEFEAEMSRKLGMPFEQIAAMSPITHGTAIVSISSVFEAYLGIFVDAQDRSLSEMITSWRSRKGSIDAQRDGQTTSSAAGHERSSTDTPTTVLPSSTELFYFYKETMERCAQLSTRATFLELCNVYKKWLKVYAEEVLGGLLSKTDRRSTESRPNHQEILQACTVLNTADYCAETTAQLEERLKGKIHPDYKDRVSLEYERELFTTVISTAILSLLKELEYSLEPSITAMLRSPWRDSSIVSSESAYIQDLTVAVSRVADLVKTEVEQRKYFRSFCDKAVGLVIARFTQAIVRARPISPVGAEQILLDLQRLKSCLLQLPKLAGEGQGSTALASYNRVVAKNVGRVDIMLQVIMCPDSPHEGFVDHYLVLIPCQSFSDFQKMLDLKGVRRNEQNNLLDIFLAKTSLLRDLQDTSVLTHIEMDGQAPASSSTYHGGSGTSSNNNSTSSGYPLPLGGIGLNMGLPGLHMPSMPTSPNSALAHNLNLFMGSLPMLQGAPSTSSTSGHGSRSATPQLAYTGPGVGFGQPPSASSGHAASESRPFGFKKIGRLFSKDG